MNRSAVRIRPSAPCRGVAQFGSALGSGPRGRWFKSSHLDQSGTSPLAKANKRGNSASLFCLPSAFRSSLRSKKLVPFEIVTALCVRLFRPHFVRPYKSSHLDQLKASLLRRQINKVQAHLAFLFVSPFARLYGRGDLSCLNSDSSLRSPIPSSLHSSLQIQSPRPVRDFALGEGKQTRQFRLAFLFAFCLSLVPSVKETCPV